jgi:hypothetical protein
MTSGKPSNMALTTWCAKACAKTWDGSRGGERRRSGCTYPLLNGAAGRAAAAIGGLQQQAAVNYDGVLWHTVEPVSAAQAGACWRSKPPALPTAHRVLERCQHSGGGVEQQGPLSRQVAGHRKQGGELGCRQRLQWRCIGKGQQGHQKLQRHFSLQKHKRTWSRLRPARVREGWNPCIAMQDSQRSGSLP